MSIDRCTIRENGHYGVACASLVFGDRKADTLPLVSPPSYKLEQLLTMLQTLSKSSSEAYSICCRYGLLGKRRFRDDCGPLYDPRERTLRRVRRRTPGNHQRRINLFWWLFCVTIKNNSANIRYSAIQLKRSFGDPGFLQIRAYGRTAPLR